MSKEENKSNLDSHLLRYLMNLKPSPRPTYVNEKFTSRLANRLIIGDFPLAKIETGRFRGPNKLSVNMVHARSTGEQQPGKLNLQNCTTSFNYSGGWHHGVDFGLAVVTSMDGVTRRCSGVTILTICKRMECES
jgi:hypothetical protein